MSNIFATNITIWCVCQDNRRICLVKNRGDVVEGVIDEPRLLENGSFREGFSRIWCLILSIDTQLLFPPLHCPLYRGCKAKNFNEML